MLHTDFTVPGVKMNLPNVGESFKARTKAKESMNGLLG